MYKESLYERMILDPMLGNVTHFKPMDRSRHEEVKQMSEYKDLVKERWSLQGALSGKRISEKEYAKRFNVWQHKFDLFKEKHERYLKRGQ